MYLRAYSSARSRLSSQYVQPEAIGGGASMPFTSRKTVR